MIGVERAVPVLRLFKLASRESHPQNTVVRVNGVAVGGKELVVMAGPCAVEDRAQILKPARFAALMEALRPVDKAMGRTV